MIVKNCPSFENDNTAKTEAHIHRRLSQLKKEGLLLSKIYNRIRPIGFQWPRMYGPPKIHKQDVTLHRILSMTGSAQHQLTQWLTSVTDPVLPFYSIHCISDSFTLLLFTRPIPTNGGMVGDHGAPKAGQLPRVWTRGCKETESRQRVSDAKRP